MLEQKLHFLIAINTKTDALALEHSISKIINGSFTIVNSFKKAEEWLLSNETDIIICDLQLNDGDAIDFMHTVKSIEKKYYSIIISEDKSTYIQDEAYKAGVNDYILVSDISTIGFKIKNLFNYFLIEKTEKQGLSSIKIDEEKYTVIKNNRTYFLPAKEFEIIKLLCTSPEKIFSRKEISSYVWKNAVITNSRIIDIHIAHIRKVIGKESIRSVKKVGYGLNAF